MVTTDVDAFVKDPHIFADISRLDAYRVWLWQWEYSKRYGGTIPISFIGMRARDWRTLFEGAETPQEMLDWFDANTDLKLSDGLWDTDQVAMSYLIFGHHQWCSLPVPNKVWRDIGMPEGVPWVEDDRCFRGCGFPNCHRKRKAKVCQWWHFHPDERIKDLREKFDEIMGSQGLVDKKAHKIYMQ